MTRSAGQPVPARRWECYADDRARSVTVTTTASDATAAREEAECAAAVLLGCECGQVIARYRGSVTVKP